MASLSAPAMPPALDLDFEENEDICRKLASANQRIDLLISGYLRRSQRELNTANVPMVIKGIIGVYNFTEQVESVQEGLIQEDLNTVMLDEYGDIEPLDAFFSVWCPQNQGAHRYSWILKVTLLNHEWLEDVEFNNRYAIGCAKKSEPNGLAFGVWNCGLSWDAQPRPDDDIQPNEQEEIINVDIFVNAKLLTWTNSVIGTRNVYFDQHVPDNEPIRLMVRFFAEGIKVELQHFTIA